MYVLAIINAREQAVGLDDVMDKLAAGPPPRAETEIERFRAWDDDDKPPCEAMNLNYTMHHLQTFWDVRERTNVVMVHYIDLQTDLEGQMRRLATILDITVAENL